MEPITATIAAGAALSVSGSAALWWHTARWAAYHARKGLPLPGSSWEALTAEAADLGRIGAWAVQGFGRDGRWAVAAPSGPLVVCVHGYTQNGTNFFGLRQALLAVGRPSIAPSLRHRLAPVRWYTDRLARELDATLGRDERFDAVCHSMGGVLLRAVLAGRPDLRARLGRVVTLGSPHAGTAAARGIPWLPEVRALKRRSSWLAALPPLVDLAPAVTTIAGSFDTIVYPVSSALEPGAAHVVLTLGHAGLLARGTAIDAVLAALRDDHAAESGPR
jgi:triacylglycerol lipase